MAKMECKVADVRFDVIRITVRKNNTGVLSGYMTSSDVQCMPDLISQLSVEDNKLDVYIDDKVSFSFLGTITDVNIAPGQQQEQELVIMFNFK